MTEYAHNHPPRCCCSGRSPITGMICPLCPEHGELAQLSNDNPANSIPANVTPRAEIEQAALDAALTGNGYLLDGKRVPPEDVTIVARDDYEYACCHQLAGRPHTDYCPTRCGNSQLASQQPYSGEFPPITETNGNPFGMTHEPQHHTTPEGTHPVHECHPDRCGMWATQTSQTPSVVSQPSTQTRQAYCGLPGGHTPHANVNEGTTCGGYPPSTEGRCAHGYGINDTCPNCDAMAQSRATPLATPTPDRCTHCDRPTHPGRNCPPRDYPR